MLLDHPTVEDFESFLRNASRPGHAARNAKILRHLLADCSDCRGQLQAMGWRGDRLERLVYLPGGSFREAELSTTMQSGYDYSRAFAKADQAVTDFLTAAPPPPVSLERLLEELDRTPQEAQLTLVEEDERFASPRLAQTLVERSHAARYADPETMVHWAGVARSIAARCATESQGSAAKLSDLRARAWGQYANALRVAGRL